jgi:hypothetical protein
VQKYMSDETIQLPDFPWKREEIWMMFEEGVRRSLMKAIHEATSDDAADHEAIVNAAMERLRAIFDAIYDLLEEPTSVPVSVSSVSEEELARRVVMATVNQLRAQAQRIVGYLAWEILIRDLHPLGFTFGKNPFS